MFLHAYLHDVFRVSEDVPILDWSEPAAEVEMPANEGVGRSRYESVCSESAEHL